MSHSHHSSPDDTDDEPTLSQLVMRTAHKLRRMSRSELEPFGLSPSQARAFGVVIRYGEHPPRLRDIAARLDIAPRSATEVVDALEERGLVERTPDPTDRRAVTIALTEAGRKLRDAMDRARARRGDEFFGHLSPGQRADLADLLQQAIAPHAKHPHHH